MLPSQVSMRKHRKPLIIDPRLFRPLPQALWDVACDRCDKRQARWGLWSPEKLEVVKGTPICSLCWLFESEWGKKRREDIDNFIHDIEVEVGKPFRRTDEGYLWSCVDANRVMCALVVTSRSFIYRNLILESGECSGT